MNQKLNIPFHNTTRHVMTNHIYVIKRHVNTPVITQGEIHAHIQQLRHRFLDPSIRSPPPPQPSDKYEIIGIRDNIEGAKRLIPSFNSNDFVYDICQLSKYNISII